SGETGSKAGGQKKAAAKTGRSGAEKGDGSSSQEGEQGSTPGAKPDGQQKRSPADAQQKSKSRTGDETGKPGGAAVSDGAGDRSAEPGEALPPQDAASAGVEANLEYARKTTEMVLKKLNNDEHNL